MQRTNLAWCHYCDYFLQKKLSREIKEITILLVLVLSSSSCFQNKQPFTENDEESLCFLVIMWQPCLSVIHLTHFEEKILPHCVSLHCNSIGQFTIKFWLPIRSIKLRIVRILSLWSRHYFTEVWNSGQICAFPFRKLELDKKRQ